MSTRQKKKRSLVPAGVVVRGDTLLSGTRTSSTIRTPRGRGLFGGELENEDLLFGCKREPIAFRIIYGVALDVWDNWFKIEMDPKNDDLVADVMDKLETLHAKDRWVQVTAFERLFGWSILLLKYTDTGDTLEDPVGEPTDITDLAVYSELDITRIEKDDDSDSERLGLPEKYTLRGQGSKKVHFSRVIHAATRLLDHPFKGLSALSPVYDDLMAIRYSRWAGALTMIRYGSGFPDVTLDGATIAKINDFIDSGQFENLNAMKYFVHNEKQHLEFKGVSGHELDPRKYYSILSESISAGSFIPEPILRGAQAGALTGSEVNEREYFKFISDQQSKYEPYLRQLIDKILVGCFNVDAGDLPQYKIIWAPSFELTEDEKATIDLKRAQIQEIRSNWWTVNELRKDEGLGTIPGGDVCLGLTKATTPKVNPPGLPLPPGFDAMIIHDQDLANSEKTLFTLLESLLQNVKQGKISREDALLSAGVIIEEHLNRMKKLVQLQIEAKIGRPLSTLSPEQERTFLTMKKKYLDSFDKIMSDANL